MASLAALATGCGTENEPGDTEPTEPTEPSELPEPSALPVLDISKLQLRQWPEGVRLIGSTGAVLPGAGTVTVTNAESGDVASAAVAADGSLSLFAPGDRLAEFVIDVDGDGVTEGRVPSLVDAAFARDGECNCGTAQVSYFTEGEDLMFGTPAMPLECFCDGDGNCPLDRDTYAAGACAEPGVSSMLGESGCGLTTVLSPDAYLVGAYYTFDNASGALRGVLPYSDAPFGTCSVGDRTGWGAFEYVYGDVLMATKDALGLTVPCASTAACRFCGSADDDIPACD